MKRFIKKFLLNFIFLFSINLLVNAFFKPTLDISTAFTVALGFSFGLAFFGINMKKVQRSTK